MTDRELLEIIATQVGSLTQNVGSLTQNVGSLTQNVDSLMQNVDLLTQDVSELKKGQKEVQNEVRRTSITIENDIKPKIAALFDGHTQINNRLDRIEKELSRHEEVIIRKIK